ncbi:RcnB family protein [Pantoea rwandensis]|uniref:Nickel/cobalt homeostasis protein RcnB n=1 Tax=Pantoea rwandensis TaxID=1076550 RepID=A0A1X1CVT6_9GAMM|nr:RcnB family protein [Pantoea rwandensis]ORM68431.1 hypothetical protein HA51_14815 [Pantoea rwandensis]
MKKTTLSLIASLIACSTLFSAASWADGPGDQHWQPRGGDQHQDHGHGPDHGGDRGPNRGPDNHGHDNHGGYADHRMSDGQREGDHFAWNGHDFRRGHPMPPEFRGPHYRVDDWRERRLPEPPRGEYWSYVDGNYVLIAAATGVITSLLLNGAFN